jgi:uncharacterized membrane protein YoaK (UPF0700 family)
MLTTEAAQRTFVHNARLAVFLSAIAGSVNATGFFVVGVYTSHVTGQVARIGDEAAQGHFALAAGAAAIVFAFFVGAFAATVLGHYSSQRMRYATPLLVEAGVLAVFGFVSERHPPLGSGLWVASAAGLSVAMGMQNALVTKISGAVVRTTHLTGVTTDLGIETFHVWHWAHDHVRGLPFREKLTRLVELRFHPQLQRIWLHFLILVSFLTGAVVGPALYLNWRHLSIYAPIAGLLLVVGWELTRPLRHGAGRTELRRAADRFVEDNMAQAMRLRREHAERKAKATGASPKKP